MKSRFSITTLALAAFTALLGLSLLPLFADPVTVSNNTAGYQVGRSATDLLGYYGNAPVVQPTSADQTALTDNTGGSVSDATLADSFTSTGAFTDSTTGSAGTTLAAGAGVTTLSFQHTFIGGTSAVETVTNYTVGYKFKILSWSAVTSVLLVGASGSRVANMEIGTTDVGTSPSTITIPIANAAVGTVTAGTAVSGANTGTSSDNISIEIATGGTAFTAGSVTFQIVIQNMDTADAIASISARANTLRTDTSVLTDNAAKTAELVNAIRAALADGKLGLIKGS